LQTFRILLEKSRNVEKLLNAISKENEQYLDDSRLNELRIKFDLEPFETTIYFVEGDCKQNIFLLNPEIKVEPKEEFIDDFDNDVKINSAVQDNLLDQFTPDTKSNIIDNHMRTKRKPKRRISGSENWDDFDNDDSQDSDFSIEKEIKLKNRKSIKNKKTKQQQEESPMP
jgi:hypothetical protein